MQEVNQTLAEAFKLDAPTGALVSSVEQGSAAERAGIESGDVVLALNGHAIDLAGDLPDMLSVAKPGDQVTLDVWRHSERRKLPQRSTMRTSLVFLAANVSRSLRPMTVSDWRFAR